MLHSVSDKMLMCIVYIFEQMEEVTPLTLQKLLYFVQEIYMVQYGKPLYSEECGAWQHGPVYNTVYELFRDFKYNRFAFFSEKPWSDARKGYDKAEFSNEIIEKFAIKEYFERVSEEYALDTISGINGDIQSKL